MEYGLQEEALVSVGVERIKYKLKIIRYYIELYRNILYYLIKQYMEGG